MEHKNVFLCLWLHCSQIYFKEKQIHRNLLVLFGITRGTLVKTWKVISTQRKQKVPWLLRFKPGGSVEFWMNLLNWVFKDDVRKKKFWIGRAGFFHLADKFKSYITLDFLGQNCVIAGALRSLMFIITNLFIFSS